MYFGGASDALVAVANRALQTVGQRLPTGFFEAFVQIGRAMLDAARPSVAPEIADQLCLVHAHLVAGLVTSHPYIVLSSVFRAWATSLGRSSGPAARGRSLISVMLAGFGAVTRMNRLLDRAEIEADADNDPFALGVVHHFRGQNLLGLGFHEPGQLAVSQAVEAFQRAGDLSVAVITMALGAFYALDREPAAALRQRLDAAEAAAFRQRNRSVLPGILGMRLWVQARAGELDAAEVQAIAHELDQSGEDADLVGAVVRDAMAAMALAHVDRPFAAEPFSRRALERVTGSPFEPPFLGVALVAAARVAIARITDARSRRRAESLVARLRRRRRTVSSLVVASHIVEARLHIANQHFDAASSALGLVISGIESHNERWHALEAHRTLASVLAGRDAPSAKAHAELAEGLERRLIEPAPPRDAEEPSVTLAPDATSETRIDLAVEALGDMVARHLGTRRLVSRATTGLRTPAAEELVQLLLVNLVLAASDAAAGSAPVRLVATRRELTEEESVRFPEAPSGPWNHLRVQVDGGRGSGPQGALAECSDLCRRIGGFLDVGEGDQVELSAWLPVSRLVAPDVQGVVAICVRDAAVQRTLVEGVRRLGFSAQVASPDDVLGDDVVGLITEEQTARVPDTLWVITVVPRREGWDRGRQLPVPFLVRELQDLLTTRMADSAPNASAGPPA